MPPGRCGDAPAGPSERPRTSARTGKRQHGQAQRRCGHRTARSYAPIRLFHLRGWEGDPSEAARRGRPRISRAALARLREAALACAIAPSPWFILSLSGCAELILWGSHSVRLLCRVGSFACFPRRLLRQIASIITVCRRKRAVCTGETRSFGLTGVLRADMLCDVSYMEQHFVMRTHVHDCFPLSIEQKMKRAFTKNCSRV